MYQYFSYLQCCDTINLFVECPPRSSEWHSLEERGIQHTSGLQHCHYKLHNLTLLPPLCQRLLILDALHKPALHI